MLEKYFLKVSYTTKGYVYIWYLVASWACEVDCNPHTKESSVLLCARIPGTTQDQLATNTSSYFCYI